MKGIGVEFSISYDMIKEMADKQLQKSELPQDAALTV
jgi:hypothetical protein